MRHEHEVAIRVLNERVRALADLVAIMGRLIHQLEGRIDRAEAGLEWSQHLQEVGDDA